MSTKLTHTNEAAIFPVLVLLVALVAAVLIRHLGLTPNLGMWALWSYTPIELLEVTRDGNRSWV